MSLKTKFFLAPLAFAVFLAPLFVSAATLSGGERYFLRKGEVVADDLYVGGGSVSIVGNVRGDLFVGGGSISVLGDISQDLVAGGGSLNLSGDVGDDLRAVGGDIMISGSVGDDLVAAGGQVYLVSGATVGGDFVGSGGSVILEGEVSGNAEANAGEVSINGIVGGSLKVRANKVVLGDDAVVRGDFVYTSPHEATISESATILGEITFNRKVSAFKGPGLNVGKWLIGLVTLWLFVKLLMFVAAGLALVLLFEKMSQGLVKCAFRNFWGELLLGLVVLIVLPVAATLLLFTVIGLPLAVLLGLIYALMLLIAKIYAGVLFGSWLHKVLTKQKEYKLTWGIAVLGVVALYFVRFIPLLGWLVGLAFMLVALGAIAKGWYEHFWIKR